MSRLERSETFLAQWFPDDSAVKMSSRGVEEKMPLHDVWNGSVRHNIAPVFIGNNRRAIVFTWHQSTHAAACLWQRDLKIIRTNRIRPRERVLIRVSVILIVVIISTARRRPCGLIYRGKIIRLIQHGCSGGYLG